MKVTKIGTRVAFSFVGQLLEGTIIDYDKDNQWVKVEDDKGIKYPCIRFNEFLDSKKSKKAVGYLIKKL